MHLLLLYFRNYTTIVSASQRTRYKAEFNRQYQEYLKLHSFIEERSRSFTELEEQLNNEVVGSDEYNVSIPDLPSGYSSQLYFYTFKYLSFIQ